jgi:hypothetical protein
MSDRIFYVGAQTQEKPPRFSGYVPAKFLTVNGRLVVDPSPLGRRSITPTATGLRFR